MNHEGIYTRTARWVTTPCSYLRTGDRVRVTDRNGDEHMVKVVKAWETGFESAYHMFLEMNYIQVELDTESRPKRHLPSESLSRIDNVVTTVGAKYLYGIRGNLGWVLFSASGDVNYHVPSSKIESWDPHN